MKFIDFERKKNGKGGRLGRRMGRCRYKFPYKPKEKKIKKSKQWEKYKRKIP